MDFAKSVFDFVLYVFSSAPTAMWPVPVGLIFSITATQWLKFFIPFEWTYRQRERAARSIAFWSGLICTWTIWALAEPTFKQRVYGGFAALIVGMASPWVWRVSVLVCLRRYPWLRDKLSQDVREPPPC